MKKSMKLEYHKNQFNGAGGYVDQWRIVRVKNTTNVVPGQFLSKSEVDSFCRSSIWDVEIVKGGGT